MTYFYNDVTDWLSVGGDLDLARDLTGSDYATNVALLRDHGVTHVLDVRSEWQDRAEWVAGGLSPANYCHAPIVDSWRHTPDEDWYKAVEDFVLDFWLNSFEGDRLLVHCHMGINRAPSAAMLALLTVDPLMDPFDAFLQIREARSAAGLVYAEAVGVRHLLGPVGRTEFAEDDDLPTEVVEFHRAIENYWTPELRQSVRKGIAHYRSHEGGTTTVGSTIEQRLDAAMGL